MSATGRRRPLKQQHRHILILGVGNLLLSDEGIGVHVAQRMMHMELPPEVHVVEGGTDGFGLVNVILEADRMILIDAVKGGGQPGSIYRFDIGDCPPYPDLFKTSVHQISILEVINLSSLIGPTPQTTIIGIEPHCLDMGMALSPQIEAKIPKIIQMIQEEVEVSLGKQQDITSIKDRCSRRQYQ
jgi:hydrogenase maturation protease